MRHRDGAHHAEADAPVLSADQRHRKVPGRHAVQQRCLLDGVAICAGSKSRFNPSTRKEPSSRRNVSQLLPLQGRTSLLWVGP